MRLSMLGFCASASFEGLNDEADLGACLATSPPCSDSGVLYSDGTPADAGGAPSQCWSADEYLRASCRVRAVDYHGDDTG